jgi:sulfur-carrier protein adenylyltransferase/sulfurtransferase
MGNSIMTTKAQPLTGQASPAGLTNEEILRYSRHLIMPEVGMEGQLKLKAARVLLIGTGGLGAPLGLYLTAAGVGHIGLVDFDVVDLRIFSGRSPLARVMLESPRRRPPALASPI